MTTPFFQATAHCATTTILLWGCCLGTGLTAAVTQPSPELVAALKPSAALVAVGNAAPMIRYDRYLKGGAHTWGADYSGWQITHALAVLAGDPSAEEKLLEQIELNLDGDHAISANGGYPAQHELHLTGTYAIIRHAPHFWENRLSAEQREKIDLVMKAALVSSAYTTADATYAGDERATALDGVTNMSRGWNPNFREGMFGGMMAGMVYFGGPDEANAILDTYDHDAFVADLEQAGLSNIHETFTWAKDHPDSNAPSGEKIEAHVRHYRFNGEPLMSPMDLLYTLTSHTYGREVNCGLNDGQGILVNGVPTGVLVAGCEDLPNRGEPGMLLEFDGVDGSGKRSSITYAYGGFRPNLTNHVMVLIGGYWEDGEHAEEILERMDIGITDLHYKLKQGYRSYHNGKGMAQPFNLTQEKWDWSFRTTIPLWFEILKPYHGV